MDWLDALGYTDGRLPELELISRLLVALIAGGLIGYDRERKARPAGLRTHMLVALAAAVFTIIMFELSAILESRPNEMLRADPLRIIEAVTAGVAFLAAGAI